MRSNWDHLPRALELADERVVDYLPRSAMIVKMSRAAVQQVVDAGDALPFAPAGKIFKEWAAIPLDLHPSWSERLEAAWEFAGGSS